MKHNFTPPGNRLPARGGLFASTSLLLLMGVALSGPAAEAHAALPVAAIENVAAIDKTIQGRVTDSETGDGLPGVNVVVKGTSVGTSTNAQGNFSIIVPNDAAKLIFSFVGYLSQ